MTYASDRERRQSRKQADSARKQNHAGTTGTRQESGWIVSANKHRGKEPSLAQKIANRLVAMGEINPAVFDIENAKVERLYPGRWQRREGAWSWNLVLNRFDGQPDVGKIFGSQFTATECAKAKDWEFYSTGSDHGIIPGKEEF